jgi:hypothetical protein
VLVLLAAETGSEATGAGAPANPVVVLLVPLNGFREVPTPLV